MKKKTSLTIFNETVKSMGYKKFKFVDKPDFTGIPLFNQPIKDVYKKLQDCPYLYQVPYSLLIKKLTDYNVEDWEKLKSKNYEPNETMNYVLLDNNNKNVIMKLWTTLKTYNCPKTGSKLQALYFYEIKEKNIKVL